MSTPSEDAVRAVLDTYASGWLSSGPRVVEFEAALAEVCDTPYAVAVTSATAALHLALRATGVMPGTEVLVWPGPDPRAASAVDLCGARVVPVDDETLLAVPADAPVTAVVAAHPDGLVGDLRPLRTWCGARELSLIEDVTETLRAGGPDGAASAGPRGPGHVAVVSLGAGSPVDVGVGAAVLTADDSVRAAVTSRRSHAMTSGTWERHHGRQASYDVVDLGYNYRLDEPRAALGLARLRDLTTRRSGSSTGPLPTDLEGGADGVMHLGRT